MNFTPLVIIVKDPEFCGSLDFFTALIDDFDPKRIEELSAFGFLCDSR